MSTWTQPGNTQRCNRNTHGMNWAEVRQCLAVFYLVHLMTRPRAAKNQQVGWIIHWSTSKHENNHQTGIVHPLRVVHLQGQDPKTRTLAPQTPEKLYSRLSADWLILQLFMFFSLVLHVVISADARRTRAGAKADEASNAACRQTTDATGSKVQHISESIGIGL